MSLVVTTHKTDGGDSDEKGIPKECILLRIYALSSSSFKILNQGPLGVMPDVLLIIPKYILTVDQSGFMSL